MTRKLSHRRLVTEQLEDRRLLCATPQGVPPGTGLAFDYPDLVMCVNDPAIQEVIVMNDITFDSLPGTGSYPTDATVAILQSKHIRGLSGSETLDVDGNASGAFYIKDSIVTIDGINITNANSYNGFHNDSPGCTLGDGNELCYFDGANYTSDAAITSVDSSLYLENVGIYRNDSSISFAGGGRLHIYDSRISDNFGLKSGSEFPNQGTGPTISISADGTEGTDNPDVRITNSEISDNDGGLYYYGGGADAAEFRVENSTLADNFPLDTEDEKSNGAKGISLDIKGAGSISIDVRNSTISGHYGTGLDLYIKDNGASSVNLNHVTITENRSGASFQCSNVPSCSGTPITIQNSIISKNQSLTAGSQFDSAIQDNIDSNRNWTNLNNSNVIGVDPRLTPLRDFGGPSVPATPGRPGTIRTHALLIDSPAIDSAINSTLALDQKLESRARDGNGDRFGVSDRGAFENQRSPMDASVVGPNAILSSADAQSGWDIVIFPSIPFPYQDLDVNDSVQITGGSIIGGGFNINVGDGFAQLDNITISDAGEVGVAAQGGLRLRDMTIEGSERNGVSADGDLLILERASIVDNEVGVSVTNASVSPWYSDVLIVESTIDDNQSDGLSLRGAKGNVVATTISNNFTGTVLRNESVVDFYNSTVSGNGYIGMFVEYSAGHEVVTGVPYWMAFEGVFSNDPCSTSSPHNCVDSSTYVVNNTFADNTFGGIARVSPHNLTIRNTIVVDGVWFQVYPNIPNGGGNYIAASSTSVVQPLSNNGGPTQTHALSANSPAANHGINGFVTESTMIQPGDYLGPPLGTDQRGVTRIMNGTVDAGAYESNLLGSPLIPTQLRNSRVTTGEQLAVAVDMDRHTSPEPGVELLMLNIAPSKSPERIDLLRINFVHAKEKESVSRVQSIDYWMASLSNLDGFDNSWM